jgi:hypothetical protein
MQSIKLDRNWSILILAITVLWGLNILRMVAGGDGELQWDFQTYYYASLAHDAGLNPYDTKDLSKVAHKTIVLDYVYPPYTLPIFRIFTSLGFDTAGYVFLGIKVLSLLLLIFIWRMFFLNDRVDALFYPFCLLAFGGTIFVDLYAGNVSIFEQLLIWSGLLFFQRGKLALFCIFIGAAALFKVVPGILLFALLLTDDRHRNSYLIVSLALVGSAMAASALLSPGLFTDFLARAGGLDERGIINPSTLALSRDVVGALGAKLNLNLPSWAGTGVFLLVCAGIVSITWLAVREKLSSLKCNPGITVFLLTLVYALILPRFKDYSYILLIPAAYFILRQPVKLNLYPCALIILLMFSPRLMSSIQN